MRRGELFALTGDAIDFKKNQIHVRQAIFWKSGKYWTKEEKGAVFLVPKTKASIRAIDMSPFVRRVLLEHKLRSKHAANGLVFVNSKGGPIDPRNFVKRHFKPAVKAAGIGHCRFHDLRHSYGSLKLEQGENIKYVQTQMGHSDVRVTLNIYSHLFKETHPEAAARTDELVFGSGK